MLKLEIGPSLGKRLSGWKTLNIVPGPQIDYSGDIAKLETIKPVLKKGTFDLIYGSHVIEHNPWFKTVHILKNLYSLLSHNGRIELWVPDFKKVIEMYLHPEECLKKDTWEFHNPNGDFMLWINGRLFAGDTKHPEAYHKLRWWHKACFDDKYLCKVMKQAGFVNISILDKPMNERDHPHGWFNLGAQGFKK